VEMEGGALRVEVGADGALRMTGPVEGIAEVTVTPEWWAAHP